MAVKIRLKRMGKIRAPFYRVVVMDSRSRRDGRAIEEIGLYDPTREPSLIQITSDRAQYWLGVGAQPTEQVEVLLKITGDWQKFKGLPGTEGTLRVAEEKVDKKRVFEAAAREAESAPKQHPADVKRAKAAEAEAAGAERRVDAEPPSTAGQIPSELPESEAPAADVPANHAPAVEADVEAAAAAAPVDEAPVEETSAEEAPAGAPTGDEETAPASDTDSSVAAEDGPVAPAEGGEATADGEPVEVPASDDAKTSEA